MCVSERSPLFNAHKSLTQLGDESDEKTSTLRADCMAGGYTVSVILYDRPDTSTYHISPGDLDEGIKALLAFLSGVIDGAESCLTYEDS